MVGGMVGNKTEASCALINDQSNMFGKYRVITGPRSFYQVLNEISSCHIGKCNGSQKENHPPNAFRPEIYQHKGKNKKVKRCPIDRVPKKRHEPVEKGVAATRIDGLE
jgi:hypothetical protein